MTNLIEPIRQHTANRDRAGQIQLCNVTPLCLILVSQFPVSHFYTGIFRVPHVYFYITCVCGVEPVDASPPGRTNWNGVLS